MLEGEPQADSYTVLKDNVDLVFTGVDYAVDGYTPRKLRKTTWSPSGDERQTYILRDEDWTDFQIPGMPSRVISLATNIVQSDGIVDTHRITVEIFGDLGHQVDSEIDFRRVGEGLVNTGVDDEDLDEYFEDKELRKLSTDHQAEVITILDVLQTFDPMFVWDDPHIE